MILLSWLPLLYLSD